MCTVYYTDVMRCDAESEDCSLALSVPDLSSEIKLSVIPVFNRSVLVTILLLQ